MTAAASNELPWENAGEAERRDNSRDSARSISHNVPKEFVRSVFSMRPLGTAGPTMLILAAALKPFPASGQTANDIAPAPPIASVQDEVGVNLTTRMISLSLPVLSIGPAERPLNHSIHFSGSRVVSHAITDDYVGGIRLGNSCGPSVATVGIGPLSECFYWSYTNDTYQFSPQKQNGSTLRDVGAGKLEYTIRDGTVHIIDLNKQNAYWELTQEGVVVEIRRPDGLVTKVNWVSDNYPRAVGLYRIEDVRRNDNFALKYVYQSNVPNTWDWLSPKVVYAYNSAQTSDPTSTMPAWPKAQFLPVHSMQSGEHSLTVTDNAGRITKYNMDAGFRVIGVKPPTSSSYEVTYEHCPTSGITYCTIPGDGGATIVKDGVRSATSEGRAITYSPYIRQTDYLENSSRDSDGRSLSVRSRRLYLSTFEPVTIVISLVQKNGTTASFENNANNRLFDQTIEMPAVTSYTYDDRGNVLTQFRGSTSQRTANYPTGCINTPRCNKPTWIKDENQNVIHLANNLRGTPDKITWPAVNGVTPQVRYKYVQLAATGQSSGIWVLSQESRCRVGNPHTSGVGCADAADEVLKTYEYSLANLLMKGIVETADSVSRRTCFSHDRAGNVIAKTSPKGTSTTCP